MYILVLFHQRNACVAVHLSMWCKKHGGKHFCDLFEIKHTQIFYSYIFDVQYNIVSGIGIAFFASNLIRIKFTLYWFCGCPIIVAIEISIPLKIISSQTSNWYKFHIDLGSLLNGQMKKLGVAPKKLYWTALIYNLGLNQMPFKVARGYLLDWEVSFLTPFLTRRRRAIS